MHSRILVLTLVMASACEESSTTMVSQAALCPPENCSSCEIGYYGPGLVPAGATLVHVDCTGVCREKNEGATVWFIDGDPNTGVYTVLAIESSSVLPQSFALSPGTERVTVVTGWATPSVSFDGCN